MKPKRKSRSSLPPLYSHEELIKRLSAPLPPEALRTRDDGLLDINFAYQIERMNQVFGLGGWTAKTGIVKRKLTTAMNGNGNRLWVVSTIVRVEAPRYKIVREQAGSHSSDNLDFAVKGAITSATGKCFSLIGIGAEVYKGLLNSGNSNGKTAQLSQDAQRNLYMCAVETGYKLCEKGHNIQMAREIALKEWGAQK